MKELLGTVVFCAFIAGKLAGGYLALWSWWWWLLLPLVPIIGAAIHGSW